MQFMKQIIAQYIGRLICCNHASLFLVFLRLPASARASEDLLLGVVSSVVEISSLELLGPQQVSRGKEKQKNSFRQACMDIALGIPRRAGA